MPDPGRMDEKTQVMDPETSAGGQLPPPSAAPKVPWYRVPVARVKDDEKLGGVVGGLCRAHGFDRTTTRIAVVIAALLVPVTIVVYIALWIMLPQDPEPAQPLEDVVRDRRRIPLYIALGVLLVATGIGSIGSWFIFGDVSWGLALVAIGILLWASPALRRDRTPTAPPAGGTPVAPSSAAFATPAPEPSAADPSAPEPSTPGTATEHPTPEPLDAGRGMAAAGATTAPLTDTARMAALPGTTPGGRAVGGWQGPAAGVSAPPRRTVPVFAVVTVLVFAGLGIAAAGDALDWWDVRALGAAIVAGVVLAVGAALSGIVNRNGGFVPLAVGLALATAFLVVVEPVLDAGAGTRTIEPVAAIAVTERLTAGELTVDLRRVDLSGTDEAPMAVTAEVGFGRLLVIVPADAVVQVHTEVGLGTLDAEGRSLASGVRQDADRLLTPPGAVAGPASARAVIVLDLRVGVGQVEVVRG